MCVYIYINYAETTQNSNVEIFEDIYCLMFLFSTTGFSLLKLLMEEHASENGVHLCLENITPS